MAKIIHIELSDADIRVAKEIIAPHLQQIRDTPALTSLLYDLDLLPEQIVYPPNAIRAVAICNLFKRALQADPPAIPHAMMTSQDFRCLACVLLGVIIAIGIAVAGIAKWARWL